VGEGLGFQRTPVSSSPSPSPPFICAQRDGGPQPSVGWRPRSEREIKRARDRVSGRWTPVGVNPTSRSRKWVRVAWDGATASWDKSPKLATWEFPIGEVEIWGISGELFLKKIATFEYKKRFTEALEVALNFTQSSALQTGYENKIPWTVTKHSCWSATLIYSRQTCAVFHS
jgi:hypothetical protein